MNAINHKKETTMKLSEAIRLGAMLKPQNFGHFTKDTSCALQAARDAVGGKHSSYQETLFEQWPWLGEAKLDCPACHVKDGPEEYTIWHLNDDHRWTRERIADWVATIEPQDAQADAALPCAQETLERVRA